MRNHALKPSSGLRSLQHVLETVIFMLSDMHTHSVCDYLVSLARIGVETPWIFEGQCFETIFLTQGEGTKMSINDFSGESSAQRLHT